MNWDEKQYVLKKIYILCRRRERKHQHFLQNKAKITVIQKLIVISGIVSCFIVLTIFESEVLCCEYYFKIIWGIVKLNSLNQKSCNKIHGPN